jgi:hypothetical protein
VGVSCRHDGAAISELLDHAGVGGAADGGGDGAFLAARAAHIGACLESTDGANRREHVLHATRSRSSAISRFPVSVRAFKEPSVTEPTIADGAITALSQALTVDNVSEQVLQRTGPGRRAPAAPGAQPAVFHRAPGPLLDLNI